MAISKEQWNGIQYALGIQYCSVKFRMPTGEELHVNKAFVAENKLALQVWIDGRYCVGWGWPDNKLYRPIVRQVWRRKTFRPGARLARQLSKQKGGKSLLRRKEFSHLNDVREYWNYDFNTAASLVRQFKKIEGLELVSCSPSEFGEVSE
ncbi:hypothetical protein YN18_001219 [Salmonella enterica subsp. enterica]|nr:hypothetical protein [Salmonella enterica subsp. enterica]EDR2888282.1 hypothetical protein [Salmonella enterica subsp. enterica]EDR6140803.1 hypothetical protein [Salmonella enterica subsp. enterica]EDU9860125.1 hypothetical protein [Salmonella enterica subsp. enterica]EDV0530411.1 hypothetical protein [Salmonella enterica subsp. enterica]